MKHRRFVTRLLNRPQMIEPSAGAAVIHALMPTARIQAFDDPYDDGYPDPAQRDPRSYSVTSTTAVIPIVGELVNRGGGMDAMSGVTSYMALQDMLTDALSDPTVDAVMLDIDSPGGEAMGNLDFAEWLAQQRGEKPIWASINQMACSAAYAIASAAEWITIGADGMAGSIGVVYCHTDLSGEMANDGVKVEYLFLGARKIDGASTGPLTDPARAEMMGKMTGIYDRFCQVVATNRGISVDAVRATQAAIYRGQDAVTAGLADEVLTQEQALMNMNTRRAAPGARNAAPIVVAAVPARGLRSAVRASDGTSPADTPPIDPMQVPDSPAPPANPDHGTEMPQRHELGDLPVEEADALPKRNSPASPAAATMVANACAKAGYTALIPGLLARGAAMTDVRAAIENADAIKAACDAAGVPHMTSTFVEEGVSLTAARKIMFDLKASSDGRVRTDAAHAGAPPAAAGAQPMVTMAGSNDVYDRLNKALGAR